ncbi:MAG: hypothetical protein R3B40_11900 [Polyangiales bacterium]|nr:hypothetical protein [Myxococcales bacterium]MCB9657288.1 hypothetical protein [Sandaracinaceae bacterium]
MATLRIGSVLALVVSLLQVGCDVRVGDGPPPTHDGGLVPRGDAGLEDAGPTDDVDLGDGAPDAGAPDAQQTDPGVAPPDLVTGEAVLGDGVTAVTLAAHEERVYRIEVPPSEHVAFRFDFTPTRAAVVMTVERFDGTGPALLGLTDGGRGIRTLAVFEPTSARTHWLRLTAAEAIDGTLSVTRTPFEDGEVCEADCARLLQLPLPIDPAVDGYDWTAGTVMRYQFGRRDLVMLVRFAGRSMAAAGYAPFYPEDFSQWDGETPGTDTGYPRHASHQRGKDVDISLYGSDGLAPWRSYCQVMYVDGRECVPGTVTGYGAYANARMFATFYQSGRVTRAFLDRELIYPTRDGADDAVLDGSVDAALRPLYSDGVHLQHWPNHDNHIHVRVSEEAYPAPSAAAAGLAVKRVARVRVQVASGAFEAP